MTSIEKIQAAEWVSTTFLIMPAIIVTVTMPAASMGEKQTAAQ
jgi:hypothetical protein